MTDYIVAIDLGTSHITGIVGERNADGTFSIVACEAVDPASCIRRGIIYNRDNTAVHISNLLKKLESHLSGSFIDKVYIGVGGQSLHTIEHVEAKNIAEGAAITNEDIDALKKQCEEYSPDLQDVLDIVPAVFYVDGRRDTKPAGVPCKRFEAHYKLVVGRSSIRRDIVKSVSELAGKELAGIIVSPLALADAMLSQEEKELGCALVDFGAGVTSVSVYKNGDLQNMSVIPLGGNLITRDIASLQLTEAEAEKLKREPGSAVLQKEDEEGVVHVDMEGTDREIAIKDLNAVIEGRAKEIVENLYARISEVTELKSLGSGIVLAGGAAELRNLPELVKEKCKVKVRHSAIRSGLVRGADNMLGNPLHMTAISLMLKGTEQCITRPVTTTTFTQEETIFTTTHDEEEEKVRSGGIFSRRPKKNPRERNPKGGENEGGGIGGFIKGLFDES